MDNIDLNVLRQVAPGKRRATAWCWARSPAPGVRRRVHRARWWRCATTAWSPARCRAAASRTTSSTRRARALPRKACPGGALRHRGRIGATLRPALRRPDRDWCSSRCRRTRCSMSCCRAWSAASACGACSRWPPARAPGPGHRRRAVAGRHDAGHAPRPELAAAGDRRRPDDAVPGADGQACWATRSRCATRATNTPAHSRCPALQLVRTMPDDTCRRSSPTVTWRWSR
jgi:hypothetical protein